MRLLFFILISFSANIIFANGITITNSNYNPTTSSLSFDISWSNAWKVPTTGSNFSSDGAWVFIKYAPNGGTAWQHLDINNVSTSVANFNAEVGNNDHGVMLTPDFCLNSTTPCSVNQVKVTLALPPIIGVNPDFKIFAMEMVKVPSDPFYLGDGVSGGTYYTIPDTLDHYYVNSSDEIMGGSGTPGNLGKVGTGVVYDIPENYPKGFREFWVMKYKITAEQYMEFLNTLSRVAQNSRTDTDISGSTITDVFVMSGSTVPASRNPIRCDANLPSGPVQFYCDLDNDGIPNEYNDGQNLIANFISKNDLMAFLDWSALRPYTKLELEKFCRGPLNPVAGEFAWGTSSYATPGNAINAGEASETFDNVGVDGPIVPDFYAGQFTGARSGFAATNTSTRLSAGATFYGIQDVHSSGIYTFYDEYANLQNLHYFDSQGDGVLGSNGSHNVATWSLCQLDIIASYWHEPISEDNLYNLVNVLDQRIEYSSGRGVVILQP